MTEYSPPLDKGIAPVVEFLAAFGIETFESCEGGEGHAYPEPTVRFHGDRGEGWKAYALVKQRNLPIQAVRRVWPINDDEPTGPYWEFVFWKKVDSLDGYYPDADRTEACL